MAYKYRKPTGEIFWRNTTRETMLRQGQLYPDCHRPTHEEMIEYGYYQEITSNPTDTQKIGTEWVYGIGECWLEVIDKTAEEIAGEAEAALQQWRNTTSVSPWQFREALNLSGLRDAVEQSVLAQSQKVKDGWQFATSFDRMNQWIIAMAYAMDITDEQLDDLFRLAMAQH